MEWQCLLGSSCLAILAVLQEASSPKQTTKNAPAPQTEATSTVSQVTATEARPKKEDGPQSSRSGAEGVSKNGHKGEICICCF